MSKLDQYKKFISTATAGTQLVAARFIAPGFRATLNSTLVDMSFREFMDELGRQRNAFSDLGQNIRIVDSTEDGSTLVVTYMLTVTFDGALVSKDGKRSVQPTNAILEIPSQDRVTFDARGKITTLEIVTDMGHTLSQML